MKTGFNHLPAWGTAALLLAATSAWAGTDTVRKEKFMIKTTDAEVIEADVSDLVVGESRAFQTKSGKAVDILRTADGVELYIDGELQDLGFGKHGAHADGIAEIDHDVDIECFSENEEECEAHLMALHDEGFTGDHGYKVITKRVEVVCDDDENCEENVWVSEDGDLHFDEDLHADGDHEVIVIKKHLD